MAVVIIVEEECSRCYKNVMLSMPNNSIGFGDEAGRIQCRRQEVGVGSFDLDCAAVKEFSFSTRTVHCEHLHSN